MCPYRVIDPEQDRDLLLEFHCRINYESETPYARSIPYETYRAQWLSTSQPATFLAHLSESKQDERTVAEFLEEDGVAVGYLWTVFYDLPDYDLIIAEVMDIGVAPDHQRRGLGRKLLQHAEDMARREGATLLRSDTGIENVASQQLHEKLEFRPYRICYEKVLRYEALGPPISPKRIAAALEQARALLRRHGYEDDISADDLRGYAEADTFYPSAIGWDEILRNPLIVAHEIVEIAELKRTGLTMTRDVIVRNLEQVYAAHLRAMEVEMALAAAEGDTVHMRERIPLFEDWDEDSLMPDSLRNRYQELHEKTLHALARLVEEE